MGWAVPAGRLALLRGVSAAGWMGRMPPIGWAWDCTAFGRWRGVMDIVAFTMFKLLVLKLSANLISFLVDNEILDFRHLACISFLSD